MPPLPIPPAVAAALAPISEALRKAFSNVAPAIHAAGNALLARSRLIRTYLNPRTSARRRAQIRAELAALRMWSWPAGRSTPALRAKRAAAIERALADAAKIGRVRVDGRWRWKVPAKLFSDTDLEVWCRLRTWRYLTQHVRRRRPRKVISRGRRIKSRRPRPQRTGPAIHRSLGS